MNSLYFATNLLLTGQAAPCTGAWTSISQSNICFFTCFGSGVGGQVDLQYQSPFFTNGDISYISFYTFTNLTTGYSPSVSLTSPVFQVRAVSSGIGNFWCALNQKN